jgi:hypothetical protein
MCQYFSCIITKDLKVHWSKKTSAHEDLITELKLEDKKLENRGFIRIEIAPKNENKMTRDPKDWQFKIDEENTLPEWFIEGRKKAEKACWVAWEQSVQIQLALEDEEKEIRDCLLYAWENSKVVARGNSKVVAWENSTVVARGNSTVVAWENSKVVARGNSTVVAWENSKVEAWENSKVVARGNSTVEAWENSTVEAWENSKVEAWENSTVEAWENSKVVARGNSTVEARGNSKVVAWGNSTVVAWENSKVEIQSSTSVVISNGKIFVHDEAIVVKTRKVDAKEA